MKRSKFVLEGRLPIFAELEEDERFVSGLNFIFPAVNRFNCRQNICARSEPFTDQLIRNPPRGFGIRERAERQQNFFGHLLGENRRFASADPATAENDITIVNHRCLSRRHRALRFVESDASAMIL